MQENSGETKTVWGSKAKSSKATLKSGRKDREGILGKGTHRGPTQSQHAQFQQQEAGSLWLKHGACFVEMGRSR